MEKLLSVMKYTPGALVVLFYPSDEQIQSLRRLRQLCRHVIAVDNSSRPNIHQHEYLKALDIRVLENCNQGGIAGAYNRGLEYLIEKNCQVFFLFDQDSEVPENYFEQMLDACAKLEDPYFLIGAKVLDVNVGRYLPAYSIQRFKLDLLPLEDQDIGLMPCSSVISSGSVLSVDTYRALGPFVEGYFIDQVDTEYCFRALHKNIPVYINTALTIKHELGKRIDHRFLFFKLTQWNMSIHRQYYSARNCIHVTRAYARQFPVLAFVNVITLLQIVSILFFETDKHKKLMAAIAGIVDGVRNRYGKFEACRPRISSFCNIP